MRNNMTGVLIYSLFCREGDLPPHRDLQSKAQNLRAARLSAGVRDRGLTDAVEHVTAFGDASGAVDLLKPHQWLA